MSRIVKRDVEQIGWKETSAKHPDVMQVVEGEKGRRVTSCESYVHAAVFAAP